jgi:hypothetical protein
MKSVLVILIAGLTLASCTKEEVKQPEQKETYFFRVKETKDNGSVEYSAVYKIDITR